MPDPARPKPGQKHSEMSRRLFMQRAAMTGVGVAGLSAFLDACGSASMATPSGSASGGLIIASPTNPVIWPIYDGNNAIASNLQPEQGATLQLYNYADYIDPAAIKSFEAKYASSGVKVTVSTFNDTNEALTKIRGGDVPYDIYFPSYDQISKMVTAKLVQPLNHSYLSNIENLWPSFQNPWYDGKWQYSVPYNVYTTGVAWRTDQVPADIGALANPYSALWDPQYAGKTAVIDDWHTAMALVLLKNGITDINTTSSADIQLMNTQLTALQGATKPKVTITMYNDLATGQLGLTQMWSGDVVNAVTYLPKGDTGSELRYWFPSDGKGMVDNDLMVILSEGKNPVLAHLFIQHMLEPAVAKGNFSTTGYQPPQVSLNPAELVKEGYLPENLKSATVLPEYFDNNTGYRLLELAPAVDAEWQQVWQQFKAGA